MGKRIPLEVRYDECAEVSRKKGQIFLGFVGDNVNGRSKCKLYCKTSGRYWETTSVEKHVMREGCPCGNCSLESAKDKSEKNILKKIDTNLGNFPVTLLGFKDDIYKGTTTHVKLRCDVHSYVWDTTEARAVAKKDYDGGGCKLCKSEKLKSIVDSKTDAIIKDLETNHGFLEGTVFWRSDRVTTGNARNYFEYTCPKCSNDEYVKRGLCSGVFQIFIGSLKAGAKSCRCSVGYRWSLPQKEFNLSRCLEKDPIIFSSWNSESSERVNLNCKDCKTEWSPLYYNVLSGGNRCPKCSKDRSYWGLYKDRLEEEDNLYLFRLLSDTEDFYKVGRSFNVNTRVKDINTYYKTECIATYKDIHSNIFYKEKATHKILSEYSYIPSTPFGGFTECFSKEILTHPEIISTFNLK